MNDVKMKNSPDRRAGISPHSFFTRRFLFVLKSLCPLLLAASSAFALEPEKAVTQYLHDAWTTEQGLPQSAAHGVVQTADGYLWLATHAGLVRFDGLRFKVFDTDNTPALPNNAGHALIAARDGALWLGTNGGLTRIKDGAFHTYTTADGLSNNEVYGIYEDRDASLWLRTTGGGINHFKDGKFTFYKTLNNVSVENAFAFLRDRNGTLWVGSYPNPLVRFDGDEAKTYGAKEGLATSFISAIHEDRAGNLWAAGRGKLFKFVGERFAEFAIEDKVVGAKADIVTTILEDRNENLWLGTTSGLFRYQKNGEVSAFTSKQGLTNDETVSLLEDREGSLWIGTHAGGLNRLRDAPFMAYTVADGLVNNDVNAFHETRAGDLWFGTSGGASLFRNGKFTNYTTDDGLPDAKVKAFYEDSKKRLWVGTYGGLAEFVNGRFRVDAEMSKKVGGLVFAIVEDRAGDLWVGSFRGGLTRFRGNEAKKFTTKDGLSDDRVEHLYEDRRGNLWVGTYDGGLTRIRDEKFTAYRTTEGLAHNVVTAIYEDRTGALWFGTVGGISRFRDGKFANITIKNGLYDNKIGGLTEDENGDFWMSSSKGVFRVAGQELNDVADGKIERVRSIVYDAADNLKTGELNGGGYRSSDNRIWFLGVKGIAVVKPNELKINDLPPPVRIESLIADNRESAASEELIQLAPGTQNLEFHYVGLSFAAPGKVKYRYRLAGYDRDWIDADTRRTAFYTNLAPGDYQFQVVAANNDGVWNETGATAKFNLRPYFYQTTWFLGLCAVGLVVAGVGANGWRVSRLKRQQKRLTAMVAERTRELSEAYQRIEADNERKTKELEEARVLQLSLLPKKLPELPNLEIAAYMKPATEVGGDYYDFHVSPDGTLTAAIGDATGHGLKAGSVVTATKSLFRAFAAEADITRIFRQLSQALKEMRLRGLFMAMTILKVKDRGFLISTAGMPAALVYRAEIKRVEEISIKALPLGSVANFDYQQREIAFAPNDCVLLMSDGFPEMFNAQGEMIGFEKAAEILLQIADRSTAQEIVNHLVAAGDAWANGRPADDDVTFVVLKAKADSNSAQSN